MTTPLIRLDTTINTNVKGSKVFGLAFVNVAGVTDAFTEAEIRAFVLPKLSDPALTGSVIVQLDNVSSGENNHSGRGDERFTGVLTKVFLNGLVDDTVTTNMADVTGTAGVDVYFLTMDGINETAVKSSYLAPFTFTIDGNEYSRSASDPLYQVTLDEDTDADLTKTPWVLVLNYVHLGGTNPALNIRDTTKGLPVLPEDGSLYFDTLDIRAVDYPNGSVSDPGSWGHTDNDLFDKTCIALGSATGNDNGVEVRFVGKTNDHTRIINFKTGKFGFLKHFRYGDQPYQNATLVEGTDFTLLDNHTAILPTGSNRLYNGPGDEAMTNYPFHISGQIHWSIGADIGSGSRWEVDNVPGNSSKNTYHQIWVRADKA
jgi:hypothetical protein